MHFALVDVDAFTVTVSFSVSSTEKARRRKQDPGIWCTATGEGELEKGQTTKPRLLDKLMSY